jgi:lipopolysaccharide biosynthesis protein
MSRLRTLAFYLPQFHPIPENDEWWGRGFTEWRKVAGGRSLFSGHYQPHVPGELGFYDLRMPEARESQASLARAYGIDGFCYWHYWFNGKRLLERPFAEVLGSGQPDFPFCLCWANENWTRRWDGHEEEVLAAQRYSAVDDVRHIEWLVEAFRDPRYVRVDDKPLFGVYRARLLPDPRATADRWRETAHRMGIGDLHLCAVESFPDERGDPAAIGFDAAVEFQPDWAALTKDLCTGPVRLLSEQGAISGLSESFDHESVCAAYSYAAVVERMTQKPTPPYRRYPCVVPQWDNSPRRGQLVDSVILHGATPRLYEKWLRHAAQQARALPTSEPLLFVNAWNEWAEGNHLEPDIRHGRAFLEATLRGIADE